MKKLARLILAGYQLVQAAQRLKRNYHYVLTVTALPGFKTYLAHLEQDYFSAFGSEDPRIRWTSASMR